MYDFHGLSVSLDGEELGYFLGIWGVLPHPHLNIRGRFVSESRGNAENDGDCTNGMGRFTRLTFSV